MLYNIIKRLLNLAGNLTYIAGGAIVLYFLWLLIRASTMDYFTIPSDSMYPTLKPGDKIIVNKLLMGARIYKDFHFEKEGQELNSIRMKGVRDIHRNDIVTFNYPYHHDQLNFVINNVFCKRVAALPGDSLGISNGHYYNNKYRMAIGLPEEQTKLSNTPDSLLYGRPFRLPPYDMGVSWTMKNYGPIYIPRKGDRIRITPLEAALYHRILEWESGLTITIDSVNHIVWGNDMPYTEHSFQHNYYFMAGDNVAYSNDSRHWGLVPEEYIIGIVSYILPQQ